MTGEKTLQILRKREEILKSNLPDDLKMELLENMERPRSLPRGLEGLYAKHSNYLVNNDVDNDSDYVQHVIYFYEEVYQEAAEMLTQWKEFFEELE